MDHNGFDLNGSWRIWMDQIHYEYQWDINGYQYYYLQDHNYPWGDLIDTINGFYWIIMDINGYQYGCSERNNITMDIRLRNGHVYKYQWPMRRQFTDIHGPYSWTIFMDYIHGPYSWTIFMDIWLVVSTILKNMSSSNGMMTFHSQLFLENHKKNNVPVATNQTFFRILKMFNRDSGTWRRSSPGHL